MGAIEPSVLSQFGPRGIIGKIYKGTTKQCNILNRQALASVVLEKTFPIISLLVLGMAIDPPPPHRGNFGHYDFLIEQYLSHKMRHVSLLRSVALPCNIKITYVTQILLNYYLVSMVKYPQNQFHW